MWECLRESLLSFSRDCGGQAVGGPVVALLAAKSLLVEGCFYAAGIEDQSGPVTIPSTRRCGRRSQSEKFGEPPREKAMKPMTSLLPSLLPGAYQQRSS